MTPSELLGRVAAAQMAETLDTASAQEGFARFLMAGLSDEEVIAIVQAVRQDPRLASRLEIGLPRYRFAGKVPDECLTDLAETVLRHMPCEREGRLMALTDESQRQSLAQVVRLDAEALLNPAQVGVWISAAGGVAEGSAALEHLDPALRGVIMLGQAPLQRFAEFVNKVVEGIGNGKTVTEALGSSLMALRVPRHDKLFDDIPEKRRSWASAWRDRLRVHWRRTCYFAKRDQDQLPISNARLNNQLKVMEDKGVGAAIIDVLTGYIAAPETISEQTRAPFQFDWSEISSFFEEVQTKEKDTIGDRTRLFFERSPDDLNVDEWDYVAKLVGRGKRLTKQPEDERFFRDNSRLLQEDARLSAMWERFVYGQKIDCTDLITGLSLCLRRLYDGRSSRPRKLRVTARQKNLKHFEALNPSACKLFECFYAGLPDDLRDVVDFKDVTAFAYSTLNLTAKKQKKGSRKEQPTSLKSRQLSFSVSLVTVDGGEEESSPSVQLIWTCDLDAVGLKLVEDLKRLAVSRKGPLLVTVGGRRAGTRSGGGLVDLADMGSLEPESVRDRGAFVPRQRHQTWIAAAWKENLLRFSETGVGVAAYAVPPLLEAFTAFEEAYRLAIDAASSEGFGSQAIADQSERYADLLAEVLEHAKTPLALEALLKPLLGIGVALIPPDYGHGVSAIVCPWHPMRLSAIQGRRMQFVEAVAPLLSSEPVSFTDNGALFFGELLRDLQHPTDPEVVPYWDGEKPDILALSDHRGGYSLHERPVSQPGEAVATSGDVKKDAEQIASIVASYLQLQPHERDNLSVVLYNSDAAALPQAVVENIRKKSDEDGETMCQVMLRHTDQKRLREVYRQLVSRPPELDALYASEATQDFMARLRISIMVNLEPATPEVGGPPCDIVFCHDVIARASQLDWLAVERRTRSIEALLPSQWSRRVPMRRGEHEATALLVRPVQTQDGWAYLDAVAALFRGQRKSTGDMKPMAMVPVRRTDIRASATRDMINETHQLANWVVNLDGLLDRQQLQDRGISVIRHRRGAGEGRNLIISSTTSDVLLRTTLSARLRRIDPVLDDEAIEKLVRRFILDANQLSGDLVLRAARRASNANELIGVVLSRFLVDHEMAEARPKIWIFLDDYAGWLGLSEGRLADLLCLSPGRDDDGVPMLDVTVTEAKFVGVASVVEKAKESERQLVDTLKRLERAVSEENATADRRIWRARLAEMLVEGLHAQALGGDVDWLDVLQDEAKCRIRVRGYSHVFGHGTPDEPSLMVDATRGISNTDGIQERFAPETVRALIRAYSDDRDPSQVRSTRLADPLEPRRETSETEPALRDAGTHDVAPQPEDRTVDRASTIPVGCEVPEGEGAAPPPETGGSRFLRLLRSYAHADAASPDDEEWLEETANRCTHALMRYGMSAYLMEKVLTPNSALLKYRGSDDLTIAKVEAKITELETTHALQVLSVRAQPGRVVISVRRPHRARLTLASIWSHWNALSEPSPVGNNRLLIAIQEDDGASLYLEPQPAPHSLVAGSTGSGKSVLVQNIILGIAATNTPQQARIILIDPKAGVDYFAFDDLPHLEERIIDQWEDALAKLENLVVEMERRYLLFRENRTSNLQGYNSRHPTAPLPAVWVIHDEFADWMQLDGYRNAVEAVVSRLGVKARAAGIYLIFAAQRPDNTVFPMQLRSNLGNRLVLRVDSAGTSDLSLGIKNGRAEKLLGQGHLAAILGGGSVPVYAQVPFIDESELVELVRVIRLDAEEAGNL